jgi:hypothetical protein
VSGGNPRVANAKIVNIKIKRVKRLIFIIFLKSKPHARLFGNE